MRPIAPSDAAALVRFHECLSPLACPNLETLTGSLEGQLDHLADTFFRRTDSDQPSCRVGALGAATPHARLHR